MYDVLHFTAFQVAVGLQLCLASCQESARPQCCSPLLQLPKPICDVSLAAALLLTPVQARGFVKAKSDDSLESYTIAVSKAIVDEDDEDVVQVGWKEGV
jgi:hypothetical protein